MSEIPPALAVIPEPTKQSNFDIIFDYLSSVVINRPEYTNLSIISVGCHIAHKMQSKHAFYIIDGKVISLNLSTLKLGSSYSGKSLLDECWIGGQKIKEGLFKALGFKGVVRLTTTEAGLIGTAYTDKSDVIIEYGDACNYDFIAYDEAKAIFNMVKSSHSGTLYDSVLGVLNGRASKKLARATIEYDTNVSLWLNTQWKHTSTFDFDSGLGNRIEVSSKVVGLSEKLEYAQNHSPFKVTDTVKMQQKQYDAINVMEPKCMMLSDKDCVIENITIDSETRYNALRKLCIENGLEAEQVDRLLVGYSIWQWDGSKTLAILTDERITAIIKTILKQHNEVLEYGELYPIYDILDNEWQFIGDIYTKAKSNKLTYMQVKDILSKLVTLKMIEVVPSCPPSGGKISFKFRRIK